MRYTIKEFRSEFPNDDACLDRVMDIRFGGRRFTCPGCNKPSQFHRIANRRAYACQLCGHHVYPCAGTIFEKSRTPLSDWFFVMYLMTSTRHGVAAKEVERQLGCTYKTAWRMCHELRKLMAASDDHGPMSGHIEVDETYVGGRQKGVRGTEGKTIVFGIKEREGTVRAGPVPDVKRRTLQPIIARNVQRGSIISSDELKTYASLKGFGYRHGAVNHSAEEWSVYDWRMDALHHVNSLEGYWSQLKRSIRGTHVHVSAKHLWKYVSEFSYRHNHRKAPALMFHRLLAGLARPRLADG